MASSIVASVGKQLGTLLAEEAKILYEVSGKINNLKKELVWMQCFLEDADNREHKDKSVSLWVAEIRDFAYAAEDLVERYIHEVSNAPPKSKGKLDALKWFLCVCGDVKALHSIGSSIDELISEFSNMRSRLQAYGIHNTPQRESSTDNLAMWERRRTYSHIEEKTVGLKKHVKKVVRKLVTGKKLHVVGICGMGGLGKTTLARKVYSHQKVKDHFTHCVWVYISKRFERRSVFEDILTVLRSDFTRKKIKGLTNDELARQICEVLEKEECLVVVDDVWSKDDWNTLKPAFGSMDRSRSKILITTRNSELVQHADRSGYTHPFGNLSDEDGWKLLQQAAFLEENSDIATEEKAKMEKLGKEMLKHCKGLPLAIVALGGILAMRKRVHEWETVGKNISSYLNGTIREGEGVSESVLHVLELSYSDLPYYLKPCFMYLGMFPEGKKILASRLYHLWEAEGLIAISSDEKEKIVGVSMDDIAESHLNHLVSRSMVHDVKRLPDGSIQSCRMHDVMRDMCLSKCREVNFMEIVECQNSEELSNDNTLSSSTKSTAKSRRCAIYIEDERKDGGCRPIFNAADLDGDAYIRSLLVYSYSRRHSYIGKLDMRQMLSVVRVLDLEGLKASDEARVLRHCIHLRYLRISGWHDSEYDHVVDYIWNCKYLETLDLQGCTMKLSNDLWKLGRLKHLYLPLTYIVLDGSTKLRLAPIQLGQIETLESFQPDKCEMEGLRKMTNLRTLSFKCGSKSMDKDVMSHLMESPCIKSGHLKSPLDLNIGANVLKEDPTILTSSSLKLICIGTLEIWAMKDTLTIVTGMLPRTLTRLLLSNCELGKEGMLEVEELPCLESLVLSGDKCRKLSFSAGSFKKLQKLDMLDMLSLEEWEVGIGSLPILGSLTLIGCGKLKRIPEGLPISIRLSCFQPFYIPGCEKYSGFGLGDVRIAAY